MQPWGQCGGVGEGAVSNGGESSIVRAQGGGGARCQIRCVTRRRRSGILLQYCTIPVRKFSNKTRLRQDSSLCEQGAAAGRGTRRCVC